MKKSLFVFIAAFCAALQSAQAVPVRVKWEQYGSAHGTTTYSSKNVNDRSKIKDLLLSNPCIFNLFNDLRTTKPLFWNRARCSNESRFYQMDIRIDGLIYVVSVSIECSDGRLGEASSGVRYRPGEGIYQITDLLSCTAGPHILSMLRNFEDASRTRVRSDQIELK